MCLVVPGEQRGGVDMDPFLFIFFVIFEIVGLYELISGLKEIIKDKKTKNYGITCYGIVRDVVFTGASVNRRPEYKAILQIVNPETHQTQEVEEIIGFDRDRYPINSYVQCKFYGGDINFESLIFEKEIPGDIKKLLVPSQTTNDSKNVEYSSDGEYVIIDGVRYTKNK